MEIISLEDVKHALVELGRLRFGEMSVEDAMREIVQTTHSMFEVDGAGLMLCNTEGHLCSVAASDDRFAHLETDPLELTDHFLHLGITEVVLDRERLELGRLDPAALFTRLDQRAGALGLKQFVQLALGQVIFDVLSFLRTAPETCRGGRVAPLVQTCGSAS